MISHNEWRAPGDLLSIAFLLVLQACAGRVDNSSERLPLASNTGSASGVTPGLAVGGSTLSSSTSGAYASSNGGAISSGVGGGTGASICGNGRVDGTEQCDDGNLVNGDGCNKYCKVEDADPCLGGGCVVTVVCGDKQLEGPETCDDGNLVDSDGCTSKCTIETGYHCPVPGRPCQLIGVQSTCGNGVVDTANGETCDDGAFNGQPGFCSAYCELDTCTEECDAGVNGSSDGGCPSSCILGPHCGDGMVNGPEQCDLGAGNSPVNAHEYGGCLVTCLLGPHCGDGILQGPEECDMGSLNGTASALCTANCRVLFYAP